MNYTERLPYEIFAYFVKNHLEEDRQRKLQQQKGIEVYNLKTLNEHLKKSDDTTYLSNQ